MATRVVIAVNLKQIVQDAVMKRFDPTSSRLLTQQPEIWLEVFRGVFGRDPKDNDDELWDFLFDPNGLHVLRDFCQLEGDEE